MREERQREKGRVKMEKRERRNEINAPGLQTMIMIN